ncbi:MAG TPA: hypothetical protein VNZ53_15670 [Steroidobacteraceae bacterium]|nr:hypothetical protein [Steroidobacteraceae bacterium]
MSPSEYRLTVTAGDELAEISVIDGSLNPVTKGVGRLDQTLAGGLYKVLVRVGSHVDEQLVALDQDRDLSFAAPNIPSPIPLASSSRSHEYHSAAAVQAATNARDTFGNGASILIFAREWTADSSGSRNNPAAGLTFLDDDENFLASIEQRADFRINGDPSAGWRCDVAPGSYRLRLDLPDGTSSERTLYAAPQTQTQIFLLQRDYVLSDGTTPRRADFSGGTVAISTYFGFDPHNRRARLSELAKYALTQTRHILSDQLLKQLLDEKFDDPMLGLLGAHLVLRDHPQDTRLFQIVTDNLLRLLGPAHPDLQALWLRRDNRSGINDLQLRTPPMLRRSWDLATEESVRNPNIIPPGSPSNAVMLNVFPAAPWLIWRSDDRSREATSIEATESHLADLLNTLAHSDAARTAAMQGPIQRLNTSLRALPGRLKSFASGAPAPSSVMPPPVPTLSVDDKVEIARVLGVSGRVIDETLQRLFH